ncbi:hypothetical protein AB6A40_007732 [Gnathostoma spinigerum]|uniref:RNA helicase n=1 Tax=Gnathostoma spinigerum TaxID=75299 RepID=A0ABD6EM28_9BILA
MAKEGNKEIDPWEAETLSQEQDERDKLAAETSSLSFASEKKPTKPTAVSSAFGAGISGRGKHGSVFGGAGRPMSYQSQLPFSSCGSPVRGSLPVQGVGPVHGNSFLRPVFGVAPTMPPGFCGDSNFHSPFGLRPMALEPLARPLRAPLNGQNRERIETNVGDEEEIDKPMTAEDISILNKILHKKLETLEQANVQVSIQQSDPTSPLYSAGTFDNLRLKDELLKALNKMGFKLPSKIQEAALPVLLVEPPQNMIAQSQSGTGKTAAFVLTMLSRVVPENHWPQCLCLAPTYELAMQIGKVVETMGEFMPDVHVKYAVKGERDPGPITEQIVIGTPGKMLDWVVKMKLIDASKIICMVFDEADVLISQQGHQDQSIRLQCELERSGARYQSLLFSATYDDAVFAFAESIIKDPVVISLRREEQALSNIKQYYVRCCSREEKYQAVMNLYSGITIASAIIFCYGALLPASLSFALPAVVSTHFLP